MSKDKYKLSYDEVRVIVIALVELKNQLIAEGRYTDPVDELLMRFVDQGSFFSPDAGIHCSACLYAELLLFQNTGITEKGNNMTTANETMKVIAKGLDKKEEPKEAVMEGKII